MPAIRSVPGCGRTGGSPICSRSRGDAAAGAQAVSVRRGVTTMTIGPLNADQLRRLGRTLIRKADEHDRLLARFRDSDDAFGLRVQTVSLCEMTVHP